MAPSEGVMHAAPDLWFALKAPVSDIACVALSPAQPKRRARRSRSRERYANSVIEFEAVAEKFNPPDGTKTLENREFGA
jgi:hypothetical protein